MATRLRGHAMGEHKLGWELPASCCCILGWVMQTVWALRVQGQWGLQDCTSILGKH